MDRVCQDGERRLQLDGEHGLVDGLAHRGAGQEGAHDRPGTPIHDDRGMAIGLGGIALGGHGEVDAELGGIDAALASLLEPEADRRGLRIGIDGARDGRVVRPNVVAQRKPRCHLALVMREVGMHLRSGDVPGDVDVLGDAELIVHLKRPVEGRAAGFAATDDRRLARGRQGESLCASSASW